MLKKVLLTCCFLTLIYLLGILNAPPASASCYCCQMEYWCRVPNYEVEWPHPCCDDITNLCEGLLTKWNVDYTYTYVSSCEELEAPCPWMLLPPMDPFIYQNISGEYISRRVVKWVRDTPADCTYLPPLNCGPSTMWANLIYAVCDSQECSDDWCD
jgi:hypothetical protein